MWFLVAMSPGVLKNFGVFLHPCVVSFRKCIYYLQLHKIQMWRFQLWFLFQEPRSFWRMTNLVLVQRIENTSMVSPSLSQDTPCKNGHTAKGFQLGKPKRTKYQKSPQEITPEDKKFNANCCTVDDKKAASKHMYFLDPNAETRRYERRLAARQKHADILYSS